MESPFTPSPLASLLLVGGLFVGAKAICNQTEEKIRPVKEGWDKETEKQEKKRRKKNG